MEPQEPPGCRTLDAPPLDPTVISVPSFATQFLYTGVNPIQTGVAAGVINLEHAALLHGQVITREGETVNYEKTGYLPAQRQQNTAWQEYENLGTVALVPLDELVTPILTDQAMIQIAQGSMVTDSSGTRQATLLFPAHTTAQLVKADDTRQSMDHLTVRATEYTVGDQGPQAMPAPLPPSSAYTYAVELSADEVLAAGADEVEFNQPVYLYVENFLNFPVGGSVPAGWYDRHRQAWIAADNGRVIQVLRIEQGAAVLDVSGKGQPATEAELAALHLTPAEREALAAHYAAGQTLWRTPVTHFTPWDCNWPYGPPDDAKYPDGEPETEENNPDDPCEQNGCIIEVESQTLGEQIDIAGTPFTLNYRSNRMPGYKAAYTVKIPFHSDTVPESLKRIDVVIAVAGREIIQSYSRESRLATFTWDGKDVFGRILQGTQEAHIKVGYVYPAIYYKPAEIARSFANIGMGAIAGNRARQEITL